MAELKQKKIYFSSTHEQAIIDYCSTQNKKEREILYTTLIGPAFDEMLNKIIFTYKFTSLPNINLLRDECKVWLITVLDKFDKSRGYKAFSYFSVITKNYFIHKVKKATQQQTKELQYEDVSKDVEHQYMTSHHDYISKREKEEYFKLLKEEIDMWLESLILKENEKKVLEAIKVLFENLDNIEIFNKKAFYLYIRELTNLSTKQIVSVLIKIKEKYVLFQDDWCNGRI